MAIIGPEKMPAILRLQNGGNDIMKFEILATLGHPQINVELGEEQLEQIIRTSGDFIAQWFAKEMQYAYFYTSPLVNTYNLPSDAYMVREVVWDPAVTRIGDIFGAESFLFNVGNVTGVQNILTDYHLLQAYRKFSAKILGTEGRWEVFGDGQIRLFPTPRGAFPVVVQYLPIVTRFKNANAKWVCKQFLVAEAKIILGNIRSKFGGLPSPDGGTIQMNGDALRTEGMEERQKALEAAVSLSEPLGPYAL